MFTWKSVSLAFAGTVLSTALALSASWDEDGGEAWKAILAKAKAEPALTVLGGCPNLAEGLSKAFKADTGLSLIFVSGSANEGAARYRAELEAGKTTIDFRLGGSSDVDMAARGKLRSIRELLMLPSVTKLENWRDGKHVWVDNAKQYLFQAAQYVSTRPVINTDLIKPDELASIKNLLDPKYKGKIAAIDPRFPSSGQSMAAYLADVVGIDFVVKLYKDQNVTVTSDQRQLAEWAARGVHPIILGLDPSLLEPLREDGMKLAVVTPKDAPGSLNGGCSVVGLAAATQKPAAATVFVNWYLSAAGQTAFSETLRVPTRRVDVTVKSVAPYLIPQSGLDYVDQYAEDWYVKRRLPLIEEVQKGLK